MKREYVTFVRRLSSLDEGVRTLFIKDLTPGPRKYDTKLVRAELAREPESLSQGDLLWIRSETGYLHPKPWGIRVLEELPPHVPGQPWQDVFTSLKNLK